MIGGDYLINGRHTWSTYLVSGYDGHIIWRVEGESGGDFGSLPEEARFRWQHDARAHNITDTSITISWFNNYNAPLYNGTRSSTLLALHFDLPPDRVKTPRVVQTVHYPNDSIYSTSQGSYTRDVAGTQNQLADYGNMPLFREFGPPAEDSDLRWEARFGTEAGSSQTYRVFKGEWHATPKTWDPSLVVERPDDAPGRKCATGHVSWNGATEVEEWNVYMAPDKGSRMEKMVVVDKHGFETAFNIPTRGCVQLGAVQSSKEVRRSNVACL